jgi:hypothetical protein
MDAVIAVLVILVLLSGLDAKAWPAPRAPQPLAARPARRLTHGPLAREAQPTAACGRWWWE